MKTSIVITCVCLFFVACACSVPASAKETDELAVRILITTGERSKDSSSQTKITSTSPTEKGSQTTEITIERDALVWQQGPSGGRRTSRAPLWKEVKLSPADKRNLLKLIRSNNLLVTDSIVLPLDPPAFYFEVWAELTLDDGKGSIHIRAPRSAVQVKEEKLYQNTLLLIKELYRIINRQDKSVLFAELIVEPSRR